MADFQGELNKLAGTVGLEAAGAANKAVAESDQTLLAAAVFL